MTADLAQPGVDLVLDITALDLPDASFDAILRSHVLKHVDDDRSASRAAADHGAGGWYVVMVPIDLGREHTHEDPSITSPEDRRRAFWQHDHVRLYAADIGDRLAAAGFDVERVCPEHEFGAQTLARCRILPGDDIWRCGHGDESLPYSGKLSSSSVPAGPRPRAAALEKRRTTGRRPS